MILVNVQKRMWKVVEKKVEVVVEPKYDVEIVVEPESSGEIEEVEEFENGEMFVEQYAVGGEFIYDVVHSVHIEEDSHTCNALVEFCSTSEICSGVREEQCVISC